MTGRTSTSVIGGTAAFLLAVTLSLIANTSGSVAAPMLASQADGIQIYNAICASCHQPGGVGLSGTFPPLAGNPSSADAGYVDQVIREGRSGPIEVLGVTYDAAMPPVELSDEDRAAVVDYVVGLASTEAAEHDPESATPAEVEPVVGDPDHGRRLFIGATGFANGGGACSGCHKAGDVGHLGGGSLGPDLDNIFATFGGTDGLTGWLNNPSSPTMVPVFADQPLTEGEVADLVAFLETAPERERPNSYGDALLIGGAIGLCLLLGGMALARRTMSPTYAQRLRHGSSPKGSSRRALSSEHRTARPLRSKR